jgi:hypothetical protein
VPYSILYCCFFFIIISLQFCVGVWLRVCTSESVSVSSLFFAFFELFSLFLIVYPSYHFVSSLRNLSRALLFLCVGAQVRYHRGFFLNTRPFFFLYIGRFIIIFIEGLILFCFAFPVG